jgi:hypothetical protein
MRTASMLPLAFTAALLAGCAAEAPRPSGHPDRDLTLQTPTTPAVEVASLVELSRPAPEPKPARRQRLSPKPAPAPTPDPVPEASPAFESAKPVPAVAVAEVLTQPAPVEDVAVGAGRELAPGTTVTIVPVSSGPSSAPVEPSWAPTRSGRGMIIEGGGHGDRCRPRGGGRGIGIAGRFPIGARGGYLR